MAVRKEMTKQSNNIAVVVVTYQSEKTLEKCLQRLCSASEVAEIAIVDNGSTDQTRAILTQFNQRESRIHLCFNEKNFGFARGCNQGAALTKSAWLAFVNPDLMIETATLAELCKHAIQIEPALLGVEQINEKGVADPAVRRADPCFRQMLRAPLRRTVLTLGVDPHRAVQDVPALSGALVFISRTFFNALKGWDEGYPLHVEDLDLCRRARLLGGRVVIVNSLKVLHIRGVSSRSRPWFVEWNKHRGLWRYFCRFEREQTTRPVRILIWFAIWAHALMKSIHLLYRRY